MTIEFKEKQIMKKEPELFGQPYIGYFAPNGDLIDFNILIKGLGGHAAYRNPISDAFLRYVSFILKEDSTETDEEEITLRGLIINYELGFNFYGINEHLESLNRTIEYSKTAYPGALKDFVLSMLEFIKNAYMNKDFFDAIQRKFYIDKYKTIKEYIEKKHSYPEYMKHILENEILEEAYKRCLAYMKDICVQYLGFDSLERFKPNGEKIYTGNYNNFDFLKTPRIITSAHIDIYERYYNYLLMEWEIHQLPRYYFNAKTRRYEKSELTYYETEKEKRYKEEIAAIRKLVPLENRPQYFR